MNDVQILVEALRDANKVFTTVTAEDVLNEMQKVAEDLRREEDTYYVDAEPGNEWFGRWVAFSRARQKIEDKIDELKTKAPHDAINQP